MLRAELSIVIPVKEDAKIVRAFRDHHLPLLSTGQVIVIDSDGGEGLEPYSRTYIKALVDEPLHIARKRGIALAEAEFTLNLDVDTLLPFNYPQAAIDLLQTNPKLVAVALDYEAPDCQGHLAFGTSVCRTLVLKQLYDWQPGHESCECVYMWGKFRRNGYLIDTLPLRVRHLKTPTRGAKYG
jgi:hypothetical protein